MLSAWYSTSPAVRLRRRAAARGSAAGGAQQPPRLKRRHEGAHHQEEEDGQAGDAELRGDLEDDVVALAARLPRVLGVVVLELAGADTGERVRRERGERFAQQHRARFARAGLVEVLVGDALQALPVRDEGSSGSASNPAKATARTTAGLRLRVCTPSTRVIAARPTAPDADCEATIAPNIITPQHAAIPRLKSETGCCIRKTARGSTATMFSAKSLGFLNMPPTDPCTRPCSTRLMPRA